MNTLHKLSMSAAVIGGLLLSTQASYAAPVRIQNPGFEADVLTDGDDTINKLEVGLQ